MTQRRAIDFCTETVTAQRLCPLLGAGANMCSFQKPVFGATKSLVLMGNAKQTPGVVCVCERLQGLAIPRNWKQRRKAHRLSA